MREHYQALVSNPEKIEGLLQAGAEKARSAATPFMGELRRAVGFRNLGFQSGATPKSKSVKLASPAFKQYREKDGKFYFKLVDAEARPLLQSQGFDSPKDAALAIALLQKEGSTAFIKLQDKVQLLDDITQSELQSALQFFVSADA